jgi:hypothetical protein
MCVCTYACAQHTNTSHNTTDNTTHSDTRDMGAHLSEEEEEGGGGGEEPAAEEAGQGETRGQRVQPPAREALQQGRAVAARRLRGLRVDVDVRGKGEEP